MSSTAHPQLSLINLRTRSMGAKFFIIVFLAFAMSISGFFVEQLTTERASSRGLPAPAAATAPLVPGTILGVQLADSYRSTYRSLRYITLFLGLVFLTYFILEIFTGKSVHPAQYVLVGIAQTVFYLLLLSLAEHLGFDLSFLVAGACTIALLSANTQWVFLSKQLARRAFAVFTLLYAFIYVLLRVENYALLVGAIASFAAVAVTMYITRNIDWYGTGQTPTPAKPSSAGGVGSAHESWLE